MAAIYRRRTVRSYAPARVEKATIEQLLDAAVRAPTALYQEPWAFAVIQDEEHLRRYSDRAKALGFAVGVLNLAEVKHELGIPESGAAVAPIILGVPKGSIPAGSRKAPEVLSWV